MARSWRSTRTAWAVLMQLRTFVPMNINSAILIYTTAPSGPPTNFTLTSISSTSMQLAWQPPLPQQRNGIIRQYVVYVQPLFRETLTYTTGSTNYTVSGLSPFTNYSFSVAAITIQTGPASEQILAQTFSAGMW